MTPPADHAAHPDPAPSHETAHATDPGAGPMDRRMWGAVILAAAVGLLIVASFVIATSGAGAY